MTNLDWRIYVVNVDPIVSILTQKRSTCCLRALVQIHFPENWVKESTLIRALYSKFRVHFGQNPGHNQIPPKKVLTKTHTVLLMGGK